MEIPRDLVSGVAREQRATRLRPEFAERLHRQLAVAFEEKRECRRAVPITQFREHLREVGRVLFLEQVDEVRRRAEAEQALYRVEYNVNPSLGQGNRGL